MSYLQNFLDMILVCDDSDMPSDPKGPLNPLLRYDSEWVSWSVSDSFRDSYRIYQACDLFNFSLIFSHVASNSSFFYYFYFFSFREKRLRVTEATAWVRFASGNVFLDIKNHFWCFGYISNCPGQFCDLLKYSESTTKQF